MHMSWRSHTFYCDIVIKMFRSLNTKLVKTTLRSVRYNSATATPTSVAQFSLFNPTDEHASLRTMLRDFVETEVDPQALEFNRKEKFNVDLFRKLGDLGLLGITVESEYGGSGMDATAAVIAHGKNIIKYHQLYNTIVNLYNNYMK